MKIYNTLTRQVDEFKPIKDGEVTIYSCGPTVYDHMHIGNLSSFIFTDTLRRVLIASGFKTNHVMNITDIDDKTIARSAEQFPDDEPSAALKNLTTHYSQIFLNDLEAVGFDIQAVKFVYATDNIADMQKLIAELYDKKFAYITEDGVYFSIKAYQDSGKIYGQLAEVTVDSTSQSRIRNDEYDKESAHDFALWKLQTNNEPAWDFELDGHQLSGRPGWHIECSAMSVKNLGQPFDIHTGGIDLIFPHHENEIAQSTAADGSSYAKYFVHNEHLLVDGRKMSKSLNNFYTLRDIIEKGYDPLAFRLMVLQSHYRSQSNFTWENLEAAHNRLNHWRAVADLQWQTAEYKEPKPKIVLNVLELLQNDLDTPAALASIDNAISVIETGATKSDRTSVVQLISTVKELLGIDLSRQDISNEQKDLISDRNKVRESKDWAKSDEIRKQLEEQGIGLKDSENETIWFRQ